ncbi:beta-amylase 8 [Alnus glutinosa]|uniref:beta-amylase 8 n=1 Tax=Alnus glutinosa TaxID=3517 RepID=UPI002D784898|nr:beta-amylase 8 [Alnus glutinosa]
MGVAMEHMQDSARNLEEEEDAKGALEFRKKRNEKMWRGGGCSTDADVQVPAVHWWYKTTSHAAELTAGFYNPTNQDGYSPVFEVLRKHSVTLKFVCLRFHVSGQEYEAFADPEGLSWQVLNSAWDRGLTVVGENALPCYDREGYMSMVEMAKPRNDPDRRHFSFSVYQQLTPLVQGTICFPELDYFIKSMHGEIAGDLVP